MEIENYLAPQRFDLQYSDATFHSENNESPYKNDSFQYFLATSSPQNVRERTFMSDTNIMVPIHSNRSQNIEEKDPNQLLDKPFRVALINPSCFEIEKPINERRFFHLPGDILIELGEQNSFGLDQKQISKIEKKQSSIVIHLQSVELSKEYDYISYLLNQSQNEQKHQLALKINKYGIIMKEIQKLILHIKNIYQDDTEKLVEMIRKRETFKMQFIQKYIQDHFTPKDFYSFAITNLDLTQDSITIKTFQFSKNLLDVAGFTDSTISYLGLRTGLLDYMQSNTRKQIFEALIESVGNNSQGPVVIHNFNISTVDKISIVCSVTIEKLFCNFPSNLRFNFQEIETIFIMRFNLCQNDIQNLQSFRNKNPINLPQVNLASQRKVNIPQFNFENVAPLYSKKDFHYQMETSMFLEKFYPNIYEQFEESEKQRETIERLQWRGECGVRQK